MEVLPEHEADGDDAEAAGADFGDGGGGASDGGGDDKEGGDEDGRADEEDGDGGDGPAAGGAELAGEGEEMAGEEGENDNGEEAEALELGGIEQNDEVVEAVGGDDADEGAGEVADAIEAAAGGEVEAVSGDAGEGEVHEVGGDEAAPDHAAAAGIVVVEVFLEGEAEADEGAGDEGEAGLAFFEQPGEEGDEEEEFAELLAEADAAEEVPKVVGEGGVLAEAEVLLLEGDEREGGPDAGDAGHDRQEGPGPAPAALQAGDLNEDDVPEGGGEQGEAELGEGQVFEAEVDEGFPLKPDIAHEAGGVVEQGGVGAVRPAGAGEEGAELGEVLEVDGPMERLGAGRGGIGKAAALGNEGVEGARGLAFLDEELGEELVGKGRGIGEGGFGFQVLARGGGGRGILLEGRGDVVEEALPEGGVGRVAIEKGRDFLAAEGKGGGVSGGGWGCSGFRRGIGGGGLACAFDEAGAAQPAGEAARLGVGAAVELLEAFAEVLPAGVEVGLDEAFEAGPLIRVGKGDDGEGEGESAAEDDQRGAEEEGGTAREVMGAGAPGHEGERKVAMGRASVARQGGVHEVGPAVDAAAQALGAGVALVAQPAGGVEGTHAVVAVDDEVLAGVAKFAAGFLSEVGEGEEFGAFDVAEVPFVGLAAVDPAGGAGGLEEFGSVSDVDFLGQGFRHGEGPFGWSGRGAQGRTVTGVPMPVWAKKISAMCPGMRTQPWEAG